MSEGPAGPIGPLAVLPAFFRLQGRRVVLAGDSEGLAWKAELVAACGARIDIFSADPAPALRDAAARLAGARLHARRWRAEDLAGAALAIGDGADPAAQDFAAAARRAGAPVNIVDRPEFCDFTFGAIVNRSPLVIGLSTDGAAPVLAQGLRAKFEALLAPHLADWAKAAFDWRKVLAARSLDFARRRRFWAAFADRALAASHPPRQADFDALAAAAEGAATAEKTGRIFLVGAGPGDPELLTLQALRALQSADVILYDDLIGKDVLELARREALRVAVGKRGYALSHPQQHISALLLAHARQGKAVVRLKGGDPTIFARANEEIAAARAEGVAITIIPGVTSALAGAAALGVSLTDRERASRVQFVTAHGKDGQLPASLDWRALADPDATTAVYMGVKTLPEFLARVLAEGLERTTPAALLANISRPDAQTWRAPIGDIAALAERTAPAAPCLLIYGRTLELAASGEAAP